MSSDLLIRPYEPRDEAAVWAIVDPVLSAGETYALPRDWTREQAVRFWISPPHIPFVAEADGAVIGTYYMQPNQQGGGAHVANCGYMTSGASAGRGVARAMCTHSLGEAARRGFRAMQFNFVVSTNERAVRLWQSLGFDIVGTLPRAFDHPAHGLVDAYTMYRFLDPAG